MTSENSPNESGAGRHGAPGAPVRRRMGGYQPLTPTDGDPQEAVPSNPGAPDADAAVDKPASENGSSAIADEAPSPGATGPSTSTRAPASEARKTRMATATSASPPARTRMGAAASSGASLDEAAPTADEPPAAKERMGPVASTGGRRRMGTSAGEASGQNTADPQAASSTALADDGAAGQRRSRMGSGKPPTSPVATPKSSTRAGTPAVGTDPKVTRDVETRADTDGGGRPSWVKPVAIIVGLVLAAVVVVLVARWLRTLEPVQEFIATYDGHASQPNATPEGMPWWLGWQHFFNMFFIVLIIRTGLQVRTERKPPGYWTAKQGTFFSPKANIPKKVSLSQWLHQFLDVFWVANGLLFVVLLFATGHWMRIVPMDWDIFPNMVSTGIQYASLNWPTENGWVHYNALQVVAYFATVFIAAPLAILSGLRMSTWWPEKSERLNKVYPVEWARAVHFPVMIYFVAFTIVHVFLVFFTGALRNLNHMYTSRDVVDWWGLVIFLVSLAVIAAAWFLTKPMFTTPIAARMGKVSR